jgi:hypothetical protein
MSRGAAVLGFGDLGADVLAARAACAASQFELKRAAEVISSEILLLEKVQGQVSSLVSRLEERLALVRSVLPPAA